MTITTQTSPLMRPPEAATYLGYSPKTLEKWRKNGEGPAFVRIGSRVRYRKEALDAWIAAREVATA